ncbi:uncharacterized protein LOC125064702 [Vanessa atalanta]|uniref:uncharacterized protein LOC125064702 n=1 Tax=Vanessa atalanta TaxID=42275 RepID=UPI001FCE07D3|nr:uncharacterized protein LOC125064702 [Vanessa atalanta]
MCLKKSVKESRDTIIIIIKNIYSRLKVNKVRDVNFNLILLNKLKELNQEHRNLSDILIPTIQENKNMRMLLYLKSVCNNENIVYNVLSQKTIMENRSINVGFQKLYLVTYRENILLKSTLKNITQEKEDAERKLIKLVNRVCQSKNNDLKAYCSQFIVQTKNNLLNGDVKAEIQKFLEKSSDDAYLPVNRVSDQINSLKLMEFINNENTIPTKENAPKLKSAFEAQVQNYIWTVKDKDGIIEKLYEYESDFHNSTMIRRIRQYSVYYDTENVVDLSNSTTLIDNQKADVSNLFCVTNQRFLSGSQAFKNFLQNNKSIVLKRSRSPNSTICIAT